MWAFVFFSSTLPLYYKNEYNEYNKERKVTHELEKDFSIATEMKLV